MSAIACKQTLIDAAYKVDVKKGSTSTDEVVYTASLRAGNLRLQPGQAVPFQVMGKTVTRDVEVRIMSVLSRNGQLVTKCGPLDESTVLAAVDSIQQGQPTAWASSVAYAQAAGSVMSARMHQVSGLFLPHMDGVTAGDRKPAWEESSLVAGDAVCELDTATPSQDPFTLAFYVKGGSETVFNPGTGCAESVTRVELPYSIFPMEYIGMDWDTWVKAHAKALNALKGETIYIGLPGQCAHTGVTVNEDTLMRDVSINVPMWVAHRMSDVPSLIDAGAADRFRQYVGAGISTPGPRFKRRG